MDFDTCGYEDLVLTLIAFAQLWAEIKLHQMLNHPHVVGFEDCFEDEENVYMVLELCENGVSLRCLESSSVGQCLAIEQRKTRCRAAEQALTFSCRA